MPVESIAKIPLVHLCALLWNSLMQIIAQCPRCSSAWLLDAAAADRRIKCRNCRRLFKVPKLDEVPKAVKIIKQAKGTIYVDEAGKTYG